jgi:hypothetical protein
MIVHEVPVERWADLLGENAKYPVQVFAAEDGDKALATVTICKSGDGRSWVFYDVNVPPVGRQAIAIVRAMHDALHFTNRMIYCACNKAHARAPNMLGFVETDETVDGFAVWVWRPWPL